MGFPAGLEVDLMSSPKGGYVGLAGDGAKGSSASGCSHCDTVKSRPKAPQATDQAECSRVLASTRAPAELCPLLPGSYSPTARSPQGSVVPCDAICVLSCVVCRAAPLLSFQAFGRGATASTSPGLSQRLAAWHDCSMPSLECRWFVRLQQQAPEDALKHTDPLGSACDTAGQP